MSNRVDELVVYSEGVETLRFALALSGHANGAVAYIADRAPVDVAPGRADRSREGASRLILYSHDSGPHVTKLPAALSLDGMVSLVSEWLRSAEYAEAPDTDGSVSRGWRITGEGPVNGWWPTICAVEAAWMVHGK
mgnify:FL=1